MSSINFGGLATGMDTGAIVDALMEIERQPIQRLEHEKAYQQSRLDAFSGFQDKLKAFLDVAQGLDSEDELLATKSELSAEGYFSVDSSETANAGAYNIEVISLAHQEKEVAGGVADGWTSAGGDMTINGQTVSVTAGSSLAAIRDQINNTADIGVTATIINDGQASPYRLVLTADAAGANGVDITANTSDVAFTPTQPGSQAHIKVDGIDVYSDSNRLTGAIPGATINLLKPHETAGDTTTLSISVDDDAIKANIQKFADAYNDIFGFFEAQKDSSWGSDSSFRTVQRSLQSMLVQSVGVSGGSFQTLAELGFSTQKDGTLIIDSTTLADAMRDDLDGVTKLFAGDGVVNGVAAQFQSYLESVTDSSDGIYASKKDVTERSVRRIDTQIDSLEARLAQREKTLRAQFDAMEQLVSGMNSQGSFLAQQMTSIANMSGS